MASDPDWGVNEERRIEQWKFWLFVLEVALIKEEKILFLFFINVNKM